MIRRVLAAALLVLVAAALALAVWPQFLGLERQPVVAQYVSLRGAAVAVALILAVVLGLIALLARPARRLMASLAVLVLAFAAVSGALVATRGIDGASLPAKQDGDLVVLSWNTLGDAPGAQRIAELALQYDADIVTLPETSNTTGTEIASIMTAAGKPMSPHAKRFDKIAKARTTAMLVSTELGDYQLDESMGSTPRIPSGVWVPADPDLPTIIAAHPVAPVPGEMASWRAGLDWLRDRCATGNLIMAGDFNSTLDHWESLRGSGGSGGELGGCHDAARANREGSVGTWPSSVPALLGAPIDHVLTSSAWTAVGFEVVTSQDDAGSDHRPVVAVLRPAG